ncbi:MAG TPA: hypothetical protein VH637_11160 [Streptosporangiaceae bacterium]|jgi:hypothetical protein
MRALKQVSLITAAAAALVLAVGTQAIAATAPPGCSAVRTPSGWQIVCGNGGRSPGGPGSGGGGGGGLNLHSGCQIEPLNGETPPYPAPKGKVWMRLVCSSILNPGMPNGLVLVPVGSTTAAPGVTPQELLQWALAELNVPAPQVQLAPPRGHDALVGLPEWFWVPRGQMRPVTVTVSVGPVFATVKAVPGQLTFSPGGGLPGVSCRGSGTPYNPALPASGQHSDCTYTYQQSSAQQPDSVYAASVSVTWTATWHGSGNTGGQVNPPLVMHTDFTLPVAEGQALVGSR